MVAPLDRRRARGQHARWRAPRDGSASTGLDVERRRRQRPSRAAVARHERAVLPAPVGAAWRQGQPPSPAAKRFREGDATPVCPQVQSASGDHPSRGWPAPRSRRLTQQNRPRIFGDEEDGEIALDIRVGRLPTPEGIPSINRIGDAAAMGGGGVVVTGCCRAVTGWVHATASRSRAAVEAAAALGTSQAARLRRLRVERHRGRIASSVAASSSWPSG